MSPLKAIKGVRRRGSVTLLRDHCVIAPTLDAGCVFFVRRRRQAVVGVVVVVVVEGSEQHRLQR